MRKSSWMWIGTVGVLVAVGLVVASFVGSAGPAPDNLEGADDANSLTRGIAQENMTIGDPSAAVEIVEYLDVACPACAKASGTIVRELISGPVREGEARLTMRPLSLLHPQTSERGTLGIRAAGAQGAAWQFATLLLNNQGSSGTDWLTDEILEAIATKTGVDVERWKDDYVGDAVASSLWADMDMSKEDALQVTPTFVVIGPSGKRVLEGVPSLDAVRDAIAEVA